MAAIRSTARKEAQAREDILIQVIKANTEVNASLKTLIEADQKNCDDCKRTNYPCGKQYSNHQNKALSSWLIQGIERPTAFTNKGP